MRDPDRRTLHPSASASSERARPGKAELPRRNFGWSVFFFLRRRCQSRGQALGYADQPPGTPSSESTASLYGAQPRSGSFASESEPSSTGAGNGASRGSRTRRTRRSERAATTSQGRTNGQQPSSNAGGRAGRRRRKGRHCGRGRREHVDARHADEDAAESSCTDLPAPASHDDLAFEISYVVVVIYTPQEHPPTTSSLVRAGRRMNHRRRLLCHLLAYSPGLWLRWC